MKRSSKRSSKRWQLRSQNTAGLVVAWFLASFLYLGEPVHAELPQVAARPQMVENELLGQWRIVGSFPVDPDAPKPLDSVCIENEHQLSWQRLEDAQFANASAVVLDKRFIDFRRTLKLWRGLGDNQIAYAVAEFQCDRAQDAILSLGHDDGVAAWLNGELIVRQDGISKWCHFEQTTANVSLNEGINRLVMKVANGTSAWGAIARFLAADVDLKKPAVEWSISNVSGGDFSRLPILDATFVDAEGNDLVSLPVDAQVDSKSYRLIYRGYTAASYDNAQTVRITSRPNDPLARFVQSIDETIPVEQASDGSFSVSITLRRPVVITAIDASTREPINDFEVWDSKTSLGRSSPVNGKSHLIGVAPTLASFYVVAHGYELKTIHPSYPFVNQIVRLTPGGRSLVGRVVDPDGNPIEGATVEPGLYSGYRPTATTDADGRFRIAGLSEDKTRYFPVVRAKGFVPKGSFAVDVNDVNDAENGDNGELSFVLNPAATVVGRVVDATGQPIQGVRLISGRDRHASNSANGETETDSEGRFELPNVPPGTAPLTFISDDHAPHVEVVRGTVGQTTELTVTLSPGKPVTGRVVDPSGRPVDDVWLIVDTWDGLRVFDRQTRSNPDGTFTLPHMPDSPSEVHVLKRDYVSKRDWMVRGGEEAEVTLSPIVKHVIRVRTADSKKVPDSMNVPDGLEVFVGYQWAGQASISWDGNRYQTQRSFNAATGTLTISDSETINGTMFYRFTADGYESVSIEKPNDAEGSQTIDLVMRRAQRVSMKVMIASADDLEPVEDAIILVQSAQANMPWWQNHGQSPQRDALLDNGLSHALTNADGVGFLNRDEIKPGDSILIFHESTGFHRIDGANAIASAALDADAPWVIPVGKACQIQGQVTHNGQPIAGESISVQYQATSSNQFDSKFHVVVTTQTDVQGRYRIGSLGPGYYRVERQRSFESPSGGGGLGMGVQAQTISLSSGKSRSVDFDTATLNPLTVTVVDESDTPMPGAIVQLQVDRFSERFEVIESDARGIAQFDWVPEEAQHLQASAYAKPTNPHGSMFDESHVGSVSLAKRGQSTIKVVVEAVRREETKKLKGTLAPAINATPLDADEMFSLEDQWGKVVAIEFWATWCGPCISVLPELKKMYDKHKDNPDFVMVSVNLDQDEAVARKLIQSQGIEYPVIFEGQGWESSIAEQFAVRGIPASFVIGRDGTFASESMHGNELPAAIELALKQKLDPKWLSDPPSTLKLATRLKGERAISPDSEQVPSAPVGVPDVIIDLQAFDESGKPVAATKLSPQGPVKNATWRYPTLTQGGRIEIVASMAGGPPIFQTIEDPDGDQTVTLTWPATSLLKIQLTNANRDANRDANQHDANQLGRVPAASAKGCLITADRGDGFTQTARTDDTGIAAFALPPGDYKFSMQPNDRWVAVGVIDRDASNSSNTKTNTSHDEVDFVRWGVDEVHLDNESTKLIQMAVCQPLTVHGTILSTDGKPSPNARFQIATMRAMDPKKIPRTDEDGRFVLHQVPSVGMTAIAAAGNTKDGAMAGYANEEFDPAADDADDFLINLTTGDEKHSATLPTGASVPPLQVIDAQTRQRVDLVSQSPSQSPSRSLIVFARTWHPADRQMIQTILAWGSDNETAVKLIAVDPQPNWREIGGERFETVSGPQDLHPRWKISGQELIAYLIEDGRVGALPNAISPAQLSETP